MKSVSVILGKEEEEMLAKFMKEHNIKTKAKAIRKCIRIAAKEQMIYNMLLDINDKVNRLLYRANITKKLLEQFYANLQFEKDQDVETEEGLLRFYRNNNIKK